MTKLRGRTNLFDKNGQTKNNGSTSATLEPWSQIAIMLISAMSFIAAFAWNGVVTSFLNQKFGIHQDYKIQLLYAVGVTISAAVAIYFIVKYTNVWVNKQQEEEDVIV